MGWPVSGKFQLVEQNNNLSTLQSKMNRNSTTSRNSRSPYEQIGVNSDARLKSANEQISQMSFRGELSLQWLSRGSSKSSKCPLFSDDVSPLREQRMNNYNQDNMSTSSYSSPLPIGSYQTQTLKSSYGQSYNKVSVVCQSFESPDLATDRCRLFPKAAIPDGYLLSGSNQQQNNVILNDATNKPFTFQGQQQQNLMGQTQGVNMPTIQGGRVINRNYLQIQSSNNAAAKLNNPLSHQSPMSSSMYANETSNMESARNATKRNRSVSRSLRSLFGRPNSLSSKSHIINKKRDKSYESSHNYDIQSGKPASLTCQT